MKETLRAPGRPLDFSTRRAMEVRLGHDFSRVRIHTDERAAASAKTLAASAYTIGDDVVFGVDRYEPATRRGRALLAHELAHVIQQRGRAGNGSFTVADSPSLEREASSAAGAVADGRSARVAGSAVGIQRQPEELTQVWRVGPIDALRARSDAQRALADAKRSRLPGLHNGPADAWRHCYWNCLMTHSIGADQAATVADTHEEFGANPTNETMMDLHNNAAGRGCGLATDDCWACCMGDLGAGRLWIIPDYAGPAAAPPMPSSGAGGAAAPAGAGRGTGYYGGPSYSGPGYYRGGRGGYSGSRYY